MTSKDTSIERDLELKIYWDEIAGLVGKDKWDDLTIGEKGMIRFGYDTAVKLITRNFKLMEQEL